MRTDQKWLRVAIVHCLIVPMLVALSFQKAHAAFIGLSDGAYDVALTCIINNCGGPFTGTVEVAGSGVSDWSFATGFDGLPLTFLGDPAEIDTGAPSFIQLAFGPSTAGGYELTLSEAKWNINTNDVVLWSGTWAAAPQGVGVPEPASLTLLGVGFAGMWARRRVRRRRKG